MTRVAGCAMLTPASCEESQLFGVDSLASAANVGFEKAWHDDVIAHSPQRYNPNLSASLQLLLSCLTIDCVTCSDFNNVDCCIPKL